MTIEEAEAVLVELPDHQLRLLNRVVAHRDAAEGGIDAEILDRARCTLADIRSGREATIPAEEVLEMLDRMPA